MIIIEKPLHTEREVCLGSSPKTEDQLAFSTSCTLVRFVFTFCSHVTQKGQCASTVKYYTQTDSTYSQTYWCLRQNDADGAQSRKKKPPSQHWKFQFEWFQRQKSIPRNKSLRRKVSKTSIFHRTSASGVENPTWATASCLSDSLG